ncbi:MAG: DNA polymerase III subunit alpha [Candidatus Neomarinimicrobiota bacterium]
MFVHLNVHSNYSPMRGTASQPALIAAARKLGQKYMALTEVNGLWGFIRFVQQARTAGIQPLAGANLVTSRFDIVLLAENQIGYENLCRTISAVHDGNQLSAAELLKDSPGLFILAHEEKTLEALSRFIPNSHLFVELRPGLSEQQARDLSKRFKLECIATGNVYFIKREEWQTQRILRAIDTNTTLSKLPPENGSADKHWFRSERDMIHLFPNSLEALNNSFYLAERCKTDWSFQNTIFPHLSLKDTRRSSKKLREKVYAGAGQRYDKITEKIKQRIEYELSLITQKGFAPYFLVVKDIVEQTRATIGRGSGAASIVSYCLFITQVDPLRYDLQFERFIHPEREDMPDIDVDFPWDERDDILEYIFRKYGNERTAMVASQVFLKQRSAIREVAKVYGLSNAEIKSITKRIGWHNSRQDLAQWVKSDPRFAGVNLDDTLLEILRHSEKIVGVFRHPSVHPGGVVIVPDEIRKYVPVLTAPKGVQIVEWEKDQVEDSGLLKIDILGNRSLSVVRDTLRQVNLNYGTAASRSKYIDYHNIQPVGDEKTENLMKSGRTMGVFYIESPATRQLLAKAGKVDFEHVVIYSSIIRPAANRFTNIMLERIHGRSWKLKHEDLGFLNESYGIMVYEEQVSMAARVLAGFGYAEADALRKTMSRDSMQHMIPYWYKKFRAGAKRRNYSDELIEEVWSMIASFVGYSFCKPHSASYAMLSFTCAYLKAHYPAEFLAAVISNQGGFYSPFAYLSEARRFGLNILTPDINSSRREYCGNKDRIRMGFMSIHNLQKKAVQAVLEERKAGLFTSLDDFLLRVELDLSAAMAFTNSGCFASLAPDWTHQEIAYRVAHFYMKSTAAPNGQAAEELAFYGSNSRGKAPIKNKLSTEQRRRLEIESFGFPVSEHPLKPYLHLLKGRVRKAGDLSKYVDRTIHLAGVYITRKVTQTIKKREPMEFLTLEDETDIYECVLFPDVFQKYADLLLWENLFILRGRVEVAFGVYTVTIEKLASLSTLAKKLEKS